MLQAQARTIQRSSVVQFWHHAVLALVRFLLQERI